MTVAQVVEGSQTCVISSEHILAETGGANALPVGSTYVLVLDLNAITTGDTIEIRVYTKTRTADTARVISVASFTNALTEFGSATAGFETIPEPTSVYTKYTIKMTAGVGRAVPWGVKAI